MPNGRWKKSHDSFPSSSLPVKLGIANKFVEIFPVMRNLIAIAGRMPFDEAVRFLVEDILRIAC